MRHDGAVRSRRAAKARTLAGAPSLAGKAEGSPATRVGRQERIVGTETRRGGSQGSCGPARARTPGQEGISLPDAAPRRPAKGALGSARGTRPRYAGVGGPASGIARRLHSLTWINFLDAAADLAVDSKRGIPRGASQGTRVRLMATTVVVIRVGACGRPLLQGLAPERVTRAP